MAVTGRIPHLELQPDAASGVPKDVCEKRRENQDDVQQNGLRLGVQGTLSNLWPSLSFQRFTQVGTWAML